MKKFVKLLPALVMLLVSAILVSTTTFAWFSMNDNVTAKNMKVKVKTEDGIVISNVTKGTWSDLANAQNTAFSLVPTSMKLVNNPGTTGNEWVHANSPQDNNANAELALTPGSSYEVLSNINWTSPNTTYGGNEGLGYIDRISLNDGQYDSGRDLPVVLLNNFFIRSASRDYSGHLYINDVNVVASGGASFNAVDNGVRVLIVLSGKNADNSTYSYPFLFAPVLNQAGGTTTTSYVWKNTTDVYARYVGGTDHGTYDQRAYNVDTGITYIFNNSDNAINVKVYFYFEGEDANVKSENIKQGITLNDLELTINFGTQAVSHP